MPFFRLWTVSNRLGWKNSDLRGAKKAFRGGVVEAVAFA
jgi:hypothetical protein